MTNEEVNKIIAEYMGLTHYVLPVLQSFSISFTKDNSKDDVKLSNDGFYFVAEGEHPSSHKTIHCRNMLYCKSLDSLIPVWERAVLEIHNTNWHDQKEWQVVLFKRGYRFDWSRAKTIQEAAAHATAKAIMALS